MKRLEEAMAFSARHPVGHLDEATRRRLLTELTSAPEGTITLADVHGQLALVATVVDVIADPAAPAELAILGAKPDLPGDRFAAEVLAPAVAFARSVGRCALQLARPAFVVEVDTALASAGFALRYESVFMRRAGTRLDVPVSVVPKGWQWVRLDEALVPAVHAALAEIFRDTPSTTLPPLEEFRRGALGASPGWHVLLDGPSVAGLVRLSAEGTNGEVRILGRRPTYRGRGLGRLLVEHGLRVLGDVGARDITLEVVATNARALELYRAFDFEVAERTPVFETAL